MAVDDGEAVREGIWVSVGLTMVGLAVRVGTVFVRLGVFVMARSPLQAARRIPANPMIRKIMDRGFLCKPIIPPTWGRSRGEASGAKVHY
jgi:hypothetical protein